MDRPFLNDPQSERGTVCPRNFLGLTDHHLLSRIEGTFGRRRVAELQDYGVTGEFDEKHLRAIHQYLFQDIFPWAGQFRLVDISKGDTDFCRAVYIAPLLAELLQALRQEKFLIDIPEPDFIPRAALYLGEMNAIHPFREGNGRTQREFIRQRAVNAGHPLSWAGFTQDEMVAASILAHSHKDYTALASILTRAIEQAQ